MATVVRRKQPDKDPIPEKSKPAPKRRSVRSAFVIAVLLGLVILAPTIGFRVSKSRTISVSSSRSKYKMPEPCGPRAIIRNPAERRHQRNAVLTFLKCSCRFMNYGLVKTRASAARSSPSRLIDGLLTNLFTSACRVRACECSRHDDSLGRANLLGSLFLLEAR